MAKSAPFVRIPNSQGADMITPASPTDKSLKPARGRKWTIAMQAPANTIESTPACTSRMIRMAATIATSARTRRVPAANDFPRAIPTARSGVAAAMIRLLREMFCTPSPVSGTITVSIWRICCSKTVSTPRIRSCRNNAMCATRCTRAFAASSRRRAAPINPPSARICRPTRSISLRMANCILSKSKLTSTWSRGDQIVVTPV